MTEDGFLFIDVGPSHSNQDLRNLTKIRCPSCNKEYLKVSKFNSSKLLCSNFENCCYETTVEQLKKEEKYIPQEMGTAYSNKPYLNQVNANKNYLGSTGNERGSYAINDGSLYDQAKKLLVKCC